MPLPLPLSLGTTKSLSPFILSHQVYQVHIDEISLPELSLLQAEQFQLPQALLTGEVLQGNSDLSGPPLDCLHMTMPLLGWGALKWAKHSRRGFTTTKQRGRITSLLMQFRVRLAFFAVRASRVFMLFGKTPEFSEKQLIHPQHILVHGDVISPNLQDLAFFLIEVVTFAYSPPGFYQYMQGNILAVFLQYCSCAVVISKVPLSLAIT